MRTEFSDEQRSQPIVQKSEAILRACVHCGMCTATCPSYQILGNELDSPRGRIYLIKSMLEEGRKPDAQMVAHIDRCLGCLACMTTCPSGVDYQHLIEETRDYIEQNYQRPLSDRILRGFLAQVLPYPRRFRPLMKMAQWVKPFRFAFKGRLRAMLELAPDSLMPPLPMDAPQTHQAIGKKRYRVAILPSCAQKVLNPKIHRASLELLTRLGVEVVDAPDMGCCGALTLHMGKSDEARKLAEKTIAAWVKIHQSEPLDAIIIHSSGCGTTIKDYGHWLKTEDARMISRLAMDITEFLFQIDISFEQKIDRKIAYHAACSLQHGQKITAEPKALLEKAGFTVVQPFESHLCCGSAGTYNMLQPEIAKSLGKRKAQALENTRPYAIAAGNLGCMTQIAQYSDIPIVHSVELLNWAAGGKKPEGL